MKSSKTLIASYSSSEVIKALLVLINALMISLWRLISQVSLRSSLSGKTIPASNGFVIPARSFALWVAK